MQQMSDYWDQLKQQVEHLSQTLNGFRVWLEHAVPDLVLYNYSLDVLEQAQAVLVLSESAELGRASFSNARSAFEASMDSLLLTTSWENFDAAGAMARACEILEHADLLDRRTAADHKLGLKRDEERKPPEKLIAEDADRWDRWAAGKGKVLTSAFQEAKADKRWKRHWSNLSRKQTWYAVESAWGESGFAEMADFFYGLMSIHGHPRPRAGVRVANITDEGKLTYLPRPIDSEAAAMIAQASCRFASAALARRRAWQGS